MIWSLTLNTRFPFPTFVAYFKIPLIQTLDVLPHVLFKNPQVPLLFPVDPVASPSQPTPWLALLVFTEDELILQGDQVTSINQALGVQLAGFTPLPQTSTLAYNFAVKDLVALSKTITQPIPYNIESAVDPSPVQAIVLQPSLFAGLFARYPLGQAKPDNANKVPDLARYRFMSHVRTFNTGGLSNHVGEQIATRSTIVCPRTGPFDIKAPVTAHAHLVSLAGISSNMQFSADKPAALISLHSWRFTYLPPSSYAVERVFQSLGQNVQPFRSPDASLSQTSTSNRDSDSWVRDRVAAGYALVKYLTPNGEATIAMKRSVLSPIRPQAIDFPPSDYGSDLAIVDEKTGLLDLTFQIAWELGRISAISDRTVSASLARLRQVIHSKALESAKDGLDSTFVPAPALMPQLINTTSVLRSRIQTFDDQFFSQRWDASSRGTPTRELLDFQTPAVQSAYRSVLASGPASHIVGAVPGQQTDLESSVEAKSSEEIYNETNVAQSTDWATLLAWIQDHLFLGGIPMHNIIPDPAFIPKESIRTFHVDPSWFKAFTDGALSIADRFDEADEVREAIKKALDTHLGTPLPDGFPPQIPRWGFFIRSEVVTKFPDLRIVAPRENAADVRPEVLRMEVLDTDLLLALFDREQGDFPGGIMIQPPDQLSSRLGSAHGVQNGKDLEIEWKKVFRDLTQGQSLSDYDTSLSPITIDITGPANGIYERESRALCPSYMADRARAAQSWPGNPPGNVSDPTAALVGSQLISSVPALKIADMHSSTSEPRSLVLNTLSSSKLRLNANASEHSNIVKVSSLLKVAVPNYLPTYSVPGNPIIGAIAKTDLEYNNEPAISNNDSAVRLALFQPPLGGDPRWPTVYTPKANTPSNNMTSRRSDTLVCTSIYNLSCPDSASNLPNYYRAIAAPYPLNLGFKFDLHIENICQVSPKSTGYRDLFSLQICFTIGTALGNVLTPFSDFTSPPNAHAVGIGRRWITRSRFGTSELLKDLGTMYIVTVLPNTGNVDAPDAKDKGYWDITRRSRDMSIVVENVQLNCDETHALGYDVPGPYPSQGSGNNPLPGGDTNYSGPGSSVNICPVYVIENYYVRDGENKDIVMTCLGVTQACVIGVDVRWWGIRRPPGVSGMPVFPGMH